MTVQSEYQLENELIAQLQQLGYATVTIKDERQLLSNLKTQIERANGLAPLSETEWKQVISFLNTGTVFERAKIYVTSFLSNLMMVQASTSFFIR
jgi:type I restriction enzyme R subunit